MAGHCRVEGRFVMLLRTTADFQQLLKECSRLRVRGNRCSQARDQDLNMPAKWILDFGLRMNRRLATLVICLTALISGMIAAHAQVGFDRPGGDYASASVRSGDPAVCAARCDRDNRCRAWSFSYPRTAARDAMCRLKNSVTAVKEDSCCVSGVRGAALVEPRGGLIEFSIDRYGGDYKSFDIAPDPTGASCAKACQADNKCRAFTYVRPGYASAAARCFLKDRITRPRRKPCCISGVVR
jgi:hypothetical protein